MAVVTYDVQLDLMYIFYNRKNMSEISIPTEMEKPERPANDDCCGGGSCCPCVWDYYFQQLSLWEAQQAKASVLEKDSSGDKG